MPTRHLALGLCALLVAGCGAAPSPSASLQTSASPRPSAPEPSVVASGPSVTELTSGSAVLPAGTYTRSGFEPRITFEVGDGWFAGSVVEGFFDVQQDKGSPDVVAVQFANVEGVVGPGGAVTAATTAEAAAQTIKSNSGITVIGESDSRVGGLTGLNLEVENDADAHTPIVEVAPGPLGIDPDRRLWISLFDTDAGVLAIMVGGSVAQWDRALALAEPMLESIVIDQ